MLQRRVQLFIACSLDGFIARADGGIDWLFGDGDYGYAEFFAGVDTVLMGRRTLEDCLKFDPWPNAGKRTIVFSRTLEEPPRADVEVTSSPVAVVVGRLRGEAGGNLWLVGGGELVRDFLAADLIDDFVISVHPIVLGAGRPLFPAIGRDVRLKLVGTRAYDSGLVTLRYRRA
jgi:dihydrofolate reductase